MPEESIAYFTPQQGMEGVAGQVGWEPHHMLNPQYPPPPSLPGLPEGLHIPAVNDQEVRIPGIEGNIFIRRPVKVTETYPDGSPAQTVDILDGAVLIRKSYLPLELLGTLKLWFLGSDEPPYKRYREEVIGPLTPELAKQLGLQEETSWIVY